MNTILPPLQEQWFELSFVLGGQLDRVAIRSTSPNALSELGDSLDRATKGYTPPQSDSIKSFSVIQIQDEPITGSASDLLGTILHASGVEGDFSSPESEALWKKIQDLACIIDDTSDQPDAKIGTVEVGFVWDNGGADDNAFEDGFAFTQKSSEESEVLHGFLELLEKWGEEESLWYDYYYSTSPSLDPREGRMSFNDFKCWVEENKDDLPDFMVGLVDEISRHELVFEMDEVLAHPLALSVRGPKRF